MGDNSSISGGIFLA